MENLLRPIARGACNVPPIKGLPWAPSPSLPPGVHNLPRSPPPRRRSFRETARGTSLSVYKPQAEYQNDDAKNRQDFSHRRAGEKSLVCLNYEMTGLSLLIDVD